MFVLSHWHPLRTVRDEVGRFQQEMDRLAGRWGIDLRTPAALAVSFPPVNLWEDDDCLYAEAELPGLKLPDLEITVTGDNELALKGKREPTAPEKVAWHRQERGSGSFERVLTLPVRVDAAKVEARLENGVLTIKLAKSETAKPRKITVRAE